MLATATRALAPALRRTTGIAKASVQQQKRQIHFDAVGGRPAPREHTKEELSQWLPSGTAMGTKAPGKHFLTYDPSLLSQYSQKDLVAMAHVERNKRYFPVAKNTVVIPERGTVSGGKAAVTGQVFESTMPIGKGGENGANQLAQSSVTSLGYKTMEFVRNKKDPQQFHYKETKDSL